MRVTLVRLLGDHREQVEVRRRHPVAGLLERLPHRALKGGFPARGLQLAADRAPDAQVGRLRPEHQQQFPRLVLEEDQDGEFVGQLGGGGHNPRKD